MNRILAIAMASGLLVASPGFAAERSVSFSVPGMTCASCPYIVEAAMGSVDGVSSVTTDFDQRLAVVTFEDTLTTTQAISAASTNAGYGATLIEADS